MMVRRRGWFLLAVCFLCLVWICPVQVSGIGCFVCTSVNGSQPECEDTFNNTGRFYKAECFAGRKGRSGLFPGTECIKLKAQHASGYRVLVRDCTVDDGGVNSDSEMGRDGESTCWTGSLVTYDDVLLTGCTLACNKDGCNAAVRVSSPLRTLLLACLVNALAVKM